MLSHAEKWPWRDIWVSPSHSQTGPMLARGSYSWPSFSGMSLFAAGSSISVIEKQYSSEHMVILHAGLARFAYQLWQSRALGMNHLNAPKFLLFSAIRQSETLWGCVREGTVVGSAVTPGSSDAGACVGMRFGGNSLCLQQRKLCLCAASEPH